MIKIDNYTVEEFEGQIPKKKIVCFCAGEKFGELSERFRLGRSLLYVVDNYTDKKTVKVGEREIPILRMHEIGDEIGECMLLIASMKYAAEIIAQLDDIPMLDGLVCYIPELFGDEADPVELAVGQPERIPRRIHYCWFGKAEMPEKFSRNIESWKKHCRDYEIVRWDESNYDVSKNLYMEQAYQAKKWGFVSDFARIDIVNEYGGVYLDTDVEVLQPWDRLLQYDLFCGFESARYVNFGLGFGAVKDNRILRDILKEYEGIAFGQKDIHGNLVACPVYQTKVLEKYGLVRNGRTQIRDGFIALSPEYFSPLNQYGTGRISERSFSVHQYAATWYEDRQREQRDKMAADYRYVIGRMEQDSGQGCLKLPWGFL